MALKSLLPFAALLYSLLSFLPRFPLSLAWLSLCDASREVTAKGRSPSGRTRKDAAWQPVKTSETPGDAAEDRQPRLGGREGLARGLLDRCTRFGWRAPNRERHRAADVSAKALPTTQPEKNSDSDHTASSQLFQDAFFPPLLCRALRDADVVRLSACDRRLRALLTPELLQIRERARLGAADVEAVARCDQPTSLQFLLRMSCALLWSLASGGSLPFDRFVCSMAYGARGMHADAVGYGSIHDIFESDDEDADDALWCY
eukprot:evm.model.scf_853EXC.3 EVM.evm.TU.scf_853EXC.3   scf_853EXC:16275-17877(+)